MDKSEFEPEDLSKEKDSNGKKDVMDVDEHVDPTGNVEDISDTPEQSIKSTPLDTDKQLLDIPSDFKKLSEEESKVDEISHVKQSVDIDSDGKKSAENIPKLEENSDIDQKELVDIPLETEKNEQNSNTDQYADNVHYEGDIAVYTDPSSKYQYVWDNEKSEWVPRTGQDVENEPSEETSGDVKDEGGMGNPETSEDLEKYGYENGTHTYTDAEGAVYMWDKEKNAWFPKVDDYFLAKYQMGYGFVDNTTSTKDEEEKNQLKIKEDKEDKEEQELKRKLQQEPTWFDVSQEQNTKVYVSNLPLDITEDEFCELMSKYGLIYRDPSSQKMKVKLYTEKGSTELKGDAICTYIRVESVDLAVELLNGSDFRGNKINVQLAKFEMKGEYNPLLKPKKKRRKDKEKMKKQQEKLFDWRPEKMRGERSKHERIVIIRNLFEPALFDVEVELILEFQQDLREECTKCGTVRRVVIYDRHPEGVAQITMAEPEEADAVVTMLNGRWFNKRQLSAEIWDGKTKFKIGETHEEVSKRLTKWNTFLETDGTLKPVDGSAKPEDGIIKSEDGIIKPEDVVSKPEDGSGKPEDGLIKSEDEILKPKDVVLKPEDGLIKQEDEILKPDEGILKSEYALLKSEASANDKLLMKPPSVPLEKAVEKP